MQLSFMIATSEFLDGFSDSARYHHIEAKSKRNSFAPFQQAFASYQPCVPIVALPVPILFYSLRRPLECDE